MKAPQQECPGVVCAVGRRWWMLGGDDQACSTPPWAPRMPSPARTRAHGFMEGGAVPANVLGASAALLSLPTRPLGACEWSQKTSMPTHPIAHSALRPCPYDGKTDCTVTLFVAR
mmetsp:Transcript_48539/g.96757  ORF Transcript_48539/g.96757 Transcript_48539/m.96757 type:complete len:115 (-) Transcript_48539:327-671(-)